ncbi:uncharacterized protein AMSG_11949 [Thecamonas trahens ATCC 50062]|uniref:SWIM-type domain-containing protein n=1 Tax=Thecamonas trahens ATCC 50062 TaxID=461836 RepID=A0A0L0DEY8_THETB|nr:hypothetical protein AMSG_11949 [Thecamonas trahens ATCC 50062]KNC49883.1 hypothetical protein AMSG_11949 [Thecamonas trahens ATCC 50062]|eukprot:XP_013757449.1 hypothetical protein AMSG_11949 [Thecamonas trahens ATCC 50062]
MAAEPELVFVVAPPGDDGRVYHAAVGRERVRRLSPAEVFASESGPARSSGGGDGGADGRHLSLRMVVNRVKEMLMNGEEVLIDDDGDRVKRRAAFVALRTKIPRLRIRFVALDPAGGRAQLLWAAAARSGPLLLLERIAAVTDGWYGPMTTAGRDVLSEPPQAWTSIRGYPSQPDERYDVLDVIRLPLILPGEKTDPWPALVFDAEVVFDVTPSSHHLSVAPVVIRPRTLAALRVWIESLPCSRIVLVVNELLLFNGGLSSELAPSVVHNQLPIGTLRAALRTACCELAGLLQTPLYAVVYTLPEATTAAPRHAPPLTHALALLHGRHHLDLDLVMCVSASSDRMEPVLAMGIHALLGSSFVDTLGMRRGTSFHGPSISKLRSLLQFRIGTRPAWLANVVWMPCPESTFPVSCAPSSYGVRDDSAVNRAFSLELDSESDGEERASWTKSASLDAFPLAPTGGAGRKGAVMSEGGVEPGPEAGVLHLGIFPAKWPAEGQASAREAGMLDVDASAAAEAVGMAPCERWEFKRVCKIVPDPDWTLSTVHPDGYLWDHLQVQQVAVEIAGGKRHSVESGMHLARKFRARFTNVCCKGPLILGTMAGTMPDPYSVWIKFAFAHHPPHAPTGIKAFGCSCPAAAKSRHACKHVVALLMLPVWASKHTPGSTEPPIISPEKSPSSRKLRDAILSGAAGVPSKTEAAASNSLSMGSSSQPLTPSLVRPSQESASLARNHAPPVAAHAPAKAKHDAPVVPLHRPPDTHELLAKVPAEVEPQPGDRMYFDAGGNFTFRRTTCLTWRSRRNSLSLKARISELSAALTESESTPAPTPFHPSSPLRLTESVASFPASESSPPQALKSPARRPLSLLADAFSEPSAEAGVSLAAFDDDDDGAARKRKREASPLAPPRPPPKTRPTTVVAPSDSDSDSDSSSGALLGLLSKHGLIE